MSRLMNWLNQTLCRLALVCKQSPVELVIAVFMAVCTALSYEHMWGEEHWGYSMLMPIFFVLSYILNRLLKSKGRFIYYLSVLFPVPFLWMGVSSWVLSAGYVVAISISFCALFVYTWVRENKSFVLRALRLLSDMFGSLFITGVAYLLLLGIYFSVTYIFGLSRTYTSDIIVYLSIFVYIVCWPLVFLIFDDRANESDEPAGISSPLFTNLLNYVFTPALLIYTAILYLYFVMILVQWSLPKGGIAICVFSFILIAAGVKACQPLLLKQYARNFYRYFSYIAVPAIGMFWVGVSCRISQYGFTEPRFYLTVCGGIMSLYVLLFMTRRWGRYLYIVLVSAFSLVVFTYIPGLTARELGIRSQAGRVERLAEQLQIWDESGYIRQGRMSESAAAHKEEMKQLYESFLYVSRETDDAFMIKHFGFDDPLVLVEKIFPFSVDSYIRPGWNDSGYIRLDWNDEKISVVGFTDIESLEDRGRQYRKGVLTIENGAGKTIFKDSANAVLKRQFEKVGWTVSDSITAQMIEEHRQQLLIYDTDSLRFIIRSMSLEVGPPVSIRELAVEYILYK